MLAKKPILHSVTAGNDLVADAKCGISVEAQNVIAIEDAINKFKTMNKQDLESMGINGYDYVMKYHDYKILAKQFLEYS